MKSSLVLLLIASASIGGRPSARPAIADKPESSQPPGASARLSSELAGSVPVRQGEHLRLSTDLGNIVIHTQSSNKLSYRVHLETDASQNNARQLLKNFALSARRTPNGVHLTGQTVQEAAGRLWVTVEASVPQDFNVDASTGGGSIEVDDIGGRIELSTAGGNITAGNIDGSARLETNGGHVTVKNVSGDLIANTGGGHITTGTIGGTASLRTSGGHIRVASVGGAAHLFTGGGNVALEHSGGELFAETSGGQIEVGEASGLVRAKTGGGGIRVVRVSGPSICARLAATST